MSSHIVSAVASLLLNEFENFTLENDKSAINQYF